MGTPKFTPEQDQAIRCIEKNVVVSAGAGSGKTRVLVERFLYILEQGLQEAEKNVSPRTILAVTFTRKAATEMRDRIRRKLMEKIEAEPDNAIFWRGQLKELSRASIGTIHSLCSAILRANPVESDLDPAFSVMEEQETKEFLQDRARRWLRQQLKGEAEAAVRLCEEYGSAGLLRQTLYLLQSGEAHFTAVNNLADYESAQKDLQQLAEDTAAYFTEALVGDCAAGNKKALSGCLDAIRAALANLDDEANIALLSDVIGRLRKSGKNAETIGLLKERLGQIVQYPACVRSAELIPYWESYLAALQQHLAAAKKEAGVLAFDDLEQMALDLLRNHPSVLEKYRSQYRYIMVDEFQDTNSRQRQLIYLLAGGDAQHLKGNHLFVVGDPKQSIYRFRGAEVSVFARVRHEIENSGGVSLQLTDNFRTVKNILSLCNHLFRTLMGEDPAQDVFYEALQANKENDIRPEFLKFSYSGKKEAGTVRKKEALGLARRLRELHDTEVFSYGGMAILLQNMTHIEAMTSALRDTGIPYAVVDGRGFYDRIEIRDMLNLFTFVSDPQNDPVLLGLLRSVYVGLNDASLTRLLLALLEEKGQERGNTVDGSLSLWDFLQRGKPLLSGAQQALLERGLSLLALLQREGRALNLPDFCQLVDDTLHPETVLALQKNGEEQLADYRKLQQLAFVFAAQKHGTVQDFARYLRRMQEEKVREAAASVEADAAVTLLTVHKSKGLEFPLVAVPFMDVGMVGDRSPIAYLPDIGLGISVRGEDGKLVPGNVLQKIREINRQKEEEEKARLLYVAMTRAEERLLLSGSEKERKKPSEARNWFNSFNLHIPQDFPGIIRTEIDDGQSGENEQENSAAPVSDRTGIFPDPNRREETSLPIIGEATANPVAPGDSLIERNFPASGAAQTSEIPESVLQQTEPLPDYGKFGRKRFSASSLQTYLWCPRQYYYQVIEEMPGTEDTESMGHELPARVLGQIVHRTLELLGRRYMEGPDETDMQASLWRTFYARAVRELAEGNALLAQPAEQMLESYLQSAVYKEFVSRQKFAEYPFQIPLTADADRTFIITGVIDAIAELPGDFLEIVDYKTGKVTGATAAEQGYVWQLALYKMAAEARFGKKVGRASLHFIRDHTVRALPENSSAASYKADILALCEEIGAKKSEAEFALRKEDCGTCPFTYFCKKFKKS